MLTLYHRYSDQSTNSNTNKSSDCKETQTMVNSDHSNTSLTINQPTTIVHGYINLETYVGNLSIIHQDGLRRIKTHVTSCFQLQYPVKNYDFTRRVYGLSLPLRSHSNFYSVVCSGVLITYPQSLMAAKVYSNSSLNVEKNQSISFKSFKTPLRT